MIRMFCLHCGFARNIGIKASFLQGGLFTYDTGDKYPIYQRWLKGSDFTECHRINANFHRTDSNVFFFNVLKTFIIRSFSYWTENHYNSFMLFMKTEFHYFIVFLFLLLKNGCDREMIDHLSCDEEKPIKIIDSNDYLQHHLGHRFKILIQILQFCIFFDAHFNQGSVGCNIQSNTPIIDKAWKFIRDLNTLPLNREGDGLLINVKMEPNQGWQTKR